MITAISQILIYCQLSDDATIEAIHNCELPMAKKQRYMEQLSLSMEDATQLTQSKSFAHYFESILPHLSKAKIKHAANWMLGEVKAYLKKNEQSIRQFPIKPDTFAVLLERLADSTLSTNGAKTVFAALCEGKLDDVDLIIKQKNIKQMNDSNELETIIKQIILDNPEKAEQYRAGKEKLLTFFVGQTMKATKGKANPQQVNALIKAHLAVT